MQKVTFPILNLELNINKTAFTIYGINIYWYAVIIVSSLILALILLKRKDKKFGINYEDILDLSISLIPISFISARVYYVIFNLKAYQNLQSILNIKDGGLAIYGGIIGRNHYRLYILQKKKNKPIRLNWLHSTSPSIRTSNRKMGKLHKYRSLWIWNKPSMENGNTRKWRNKICTSNISLWIHSNIHNICNINQHIEKKKIHGRNNISLYNSIFRSKVFHRRTKNRQPNVRKY